MKSQAKKVGGNKGGCFRSLGRRSARAVRRSVKKSVITVGELVAAAYDAANGDAKRAAELLSPGSPLYALLGRDVVIA